jgi:iron complex transport system substrate-binding protein
VIRSRKLFRRIRWPSKRCAILFILLTGLVFVLTGCQKATAEYQITVDGTLEETGVVSYLGYDINVYQDAASNPCGDCAFQPVHLYVGDSAGETIKAIKESVERSDDLWTVKSTDKHTIILQEKTPGSVTQIVAPSAPKGLILATKVLKGEVEVVTAQNADKETIPVLETSAEMNDPSRLAAVYGPSYEALTVLGVEDRIVVRADVQTENFPWANKVFKRISQVPVLDNVHTAVNIEELMKYNPDMVYTFPRRSELAQLEKAGIQAMSGTSGKKLNDVKEQLMDYAKSLNQDAVDRAAVYGEYFDEKMNDVTSVTDQIPEQDRPSVYYAGVDILTTYGKYSDIPEVIEAAGGKAVSKDLNAGSRTQIDQEQFLAWNPDYIFIDHGGMNGGKTAEEIRSELLKKKNFKKVSAVEAEQVYICPSGVFYWDMGLQKILLVMQMAEILHPDKFTELDMEKEVMEFYSRFYAYTLTRDEARQILERDEE